MKVVTVNVVGIDYSLLYDSINVSRRSCTYGITFQRAPWGFQGKENFLLVKGTVGRVCH